MYGVKANTMVRMHMPGDPCISQIPIYPAAPNANHHRCDRRRRHIVSCAYRLQYYNNNAIISTAYDTLYFSSLGFRDRLCMRVAVQCLFCCPLYKLKGAFVPGSLLTARAGNKASLSPVTPYTYVSLAARRGVSSYVVESCLVW